MTVPKLALISAAVAVAALICVVGVLLLNRPARAIAPLPEPNGYNDFTAAAAAIAVGTQADLLDQPAESLRREVEQNSMALNLVRSGLQKQAAVPIEFDVSLPSSTPQLARMKRLAHLLVAEGMTHELGGRTNAAVKSYLDCARFAQASGRGGLVIHDLVAAAAEALCEKPLRRVAAALSADELRMVIGELTAIDQARESIDAVLAREREWVRGTYGALRTISMDMVMFKSRRDMRTTYERSRKRSVARFRMLITELALHLHQREHGRFPQTLQELDPNLPGPARLDPFSEREFIYRLTTNWYQLYSVGPDGRDDGGRPVKPGRPEGDVLPTRR